MRNNRKFFKIVLSFVFLSVSSVYAFEDDDKFKNKDIFAPWNDPVLKHDILAPWNDPILKDDIFAPWNSIISDPKSTNDYLKDSGVEDYYYYLD